MPPSDQPAWLAQAWPELGQHETPGPSTNPHVRAFFADAGHPEITDDETAWCAAFIGACLHRADITPSGSLMARSYTTWGIALDAPRTGAIAVLSRPPDPAAGHVGFLIGETADALILLGGNQNNAVSVTAFPKSRLVALRWPLAPTSTPLPTPTLPTGEEHTQAPAHPGPIFPSALAHVLEMEGGYTNDPADPGGPTNFGITLADYASHLNETLSDHNRDRLTTALQHIEPQTVRAIYFTRYWTPTGCDELPPPLSFLHFDTAVNMGTGTAVRMLQTAVGCEIDGSFGPLTRAAAAAASPYVALATYADLRRRRYRSLSTFPRFGRGWLARVDTTLARATALISAQPQGHPMTSQSPLPDQAPAGAAATAPEPKWWGHSLTIWGAVVAGLAAVAPALGQATGIDITPDVIHRSADQVQVILQAAVGLAGTLAAILGRVRAKQPLTQRAVTLNI